ncbi:carbohydrate ABC transporter permease [Microbacterium oxydans]|uniref:carbohydrate ABC transporter permease n=1 Tax=Microbacterium oxydans TaxID=82380 RepID=UPI000B81F3F0|nr:carbohydrate ABC transporter permease [Microbacterium oxydans]
MLRTKRSIGLRYAAIAVVGLIMGLPVFYAVSTSLMTAKEVVAYPPNLLPTEIRWENYAEALQFLSGPVIFNSFLFSIGVILIQLVLALPAGFALAKIPFRWAAVVIAVLAAPLLLPSNATLIPLFVVTRELGILNSYAGLILPVAASTTFATLLFRQFFATLPDGIIEAARIDGASWFRVLTQIALPLAKPTLAAFASITFLNVWNMYVWPQLVAPNPDLKVIPVALAPLARGEYQSISESVGMAAAVLSIIPVLLIFIFTQKWYINGIVGTGQD